MLKPNKLTFSEDIHGALVKGMNRSLLIVIIGALNFRKREHLIREFLVQSHQGDQRDNSSSRLTQFAK